MALTRFFLLGWTALVALSACSGESSRIEPGGDGSAAGSEAKAAAPGFVESRAFIPSKAEASGSFTRLDQETLGFEFINKLSKEHQKRYLENGSGVAIGDFDGDGKADLFLASVDGPNRLLRQDGDLHFVDVTESAGVAKQGVRWTRSATFVDIDGDEDLDLYVSHSGTADQLFINDGKGKFAEDAAARGLGYAGGSNSAHFADYDRDGDLDMYLVTNHVLSVQEALEGKDAKLRLVNGQPTVHPDFAEYYMVLDGHVTQAGPLDLLYENDGTGHFTDATDEAGISGYGMGLSARWTDFDSDGWPDLYVANDLKTADRLYINQRDGTFVERSAEWMKHTPWSAMGSDTGDVNNDGRPDLFVVDMLGSTHYKNKMGMGGMSDAGWFLEFGWPRQSMRNSMYLGGGTDSFVETAHVFGLDATDWSWAPRLVDFDNDGWLDAFVTNGHARSLMNPDVIANSPRRENPNLMEHEVDFPVLRERNRAYRNIEGREFVDRATAWGLDHESISHGAAVADLDGDGDLDLVVNNLNEPVAVYRNDIGKGGAVRVRLEGAGANTQAIGARVSGRVGKLELMREQFPVAGFAGSDAIGLHFGVGAQAAMEEVEVRWPSGRIQPVGRLAAGQVHTIREDTSIAVGEAPDAKGPLLVELEPGVMPQGQHSDQPFDDFAREALLPWRMSAAGPRLSRSEKPKPTELFVTGGNGQLGALLRTTDTGVGPAPQAMPLDDPMAEESAVLFFDADADGDQDLYLARGSNEARSGATAYADRLLLREGEGWKVAAGALPDLGSSVGALAASDVDGDGDLDLFVGARQIPGQYPLTPESHLLLNQGGTFSVAPPVVIGEAARAGLVTDAAWADLDGDGREDLVLTLEWGAPSVFFNREGKLVAAPKPDGVEARTGLWRSLALADLDDDGDVDMVTGNWGTNSKYHASPERPLTLFYDDFDDDGTLDLVEAEFEDTTLYPVRGRSCSSGAMGFIAEKFETYHSFASASMGEIYGVERLAAAPFKAVNELETLLWLNDGKGNFEPRALPLLAQLAPVNDVVIDDFDGDGKPDIFLAQNFFGAQPETGLLDGGLSVLLLGDGKGGFRELWPEESGVAIPEEASSAQVVSLAGGERVLVVAINRGSLRGWRLPRASAG